MRKTPPSPSSPFPLLAPADVPTTAVAVAAPLPPETLRDVAELLRGSRAEATQEAYASDWRHWEAWCRLRGQVAFPATPEGLVGYIAELARTKALSTIERRLSTITTLHKLRKVEPNPGLASEVRMVMAGVVRKKGRRVRQVDPLLREDLVRMLAQVPAGLPGLRDRALLLLAFAGAFRSAEVVAIQVEHLRWLPKGVVVHVPHSKTDQEGTGVDKPVAFVEGPLCAAGALRAWLKAAGLTEGPVFRPFTRYKQLRRTARHVTPAVVYELVKRYGEAAGLPVDRIASHSLRAGHVTQGYDDGVDESLLMKMTGHTTLEMLRRYDRRGAKDPFAGASSALLGGPPKREKQ